MIKLDVLQINKSLNNIALAIRKQILDNTRKGVDMDGNPFKEYSESYLNAKADYQSKGKVTAAKMVRASVVNMRLSGVMLRSISVRKVANGYEIFFADKSRAFIAYAHQTGKGNLPERKFFGVSPADEKRFYAQYFNRPVLKVTL